MSALMLSLKLKLLQGSQPSIAHITCFLLLSLLIAHFHAIVAKRPGLHLSPERLAEGPDLIARLVSGLPLMESCRTSQINAPPVTVEDIYDDIHTSQTALRRNMAWMVLL